MVCIDVDDLAWGVSEVPHWREDLADRGQLGLERLPLGAEPPLLRRLLTELFVEGALLCCFVPCRAEATGIWRLGAAG